MMTTERYMNNKNFSIIETSEIAHLYNGKKVLDIPPLSFNKNKIYAVLGPNGSGKTTLLNILGLLLRPTIGKVFFQGIDVYTNQVFINDIRSKMTTVIQNPVLFDTTVEKNIDFGLRIRGENKEERKRVVNDCLKMVRLEGFQKRKAKELSGGEAQRVAIARALAVRPQVLFLDEFTSNVDERSIEVLEEVIKKVNQLFGSTIFLVTHDTHQAYKLADEVINLFEGRVVKSSLENLFRGRMSKTNNLSTFDTGKMKIEVVTDREGLVYAAINPRDIVISHQPLSSSARNSFNGIIKKIIDDGISVRLSIKAGEELSVKITKESFAEMKLNVGSNIYLTFKSTAVEVF